MRIDDNLTDLMVKANCSMLLRERGKVVPGSHRIGHNVFTVTGRNLLAKLVSWQTIAATDIPYTHRRVRWVGVGIDNQLEVSTVSSLKQATLATSTDYLVPIQSVEFPSSTSVRFIRTFATNEITITSTPVTIKEAGLFADVNPATAGGVEDAAVGGGVLTTLDPSLASNPPVAYKAFDGLTKTVDFTYEIRWDFRF